MKRMLWIILMMSCGATYISSLFPVYSEYYHLDGFQISVLFAIYAIFLIPSLLIVNAKGNVWGLKNVIRYSIWLSLLSTMIFLASFDVWMLYTARILEGIAYGAFTGTAAAYLIKNTPPQKLNTAIKLSGITVLIGFGLGPAIAGIVIEYVQFQPLRLPYWVLFFMLISSLILLELMPNQHDSPVQNMVKTKSILGVPSNIRSHFWSFIGLPIFITFTFGGIVFSLIPSFTKNVIQTANLSIPGLLILLLLGGGAVWQLFPWPRNSINRMRLGVLFLAIGSWVTIYSGQTANIVFLWLGMFVQGIGAGWTFQVSLKFASQLPSPEERPGMISAFYLCAYSGFIFPVVGVGLLTHLFNLNFSLLLINLFATIIIVYILLYSATFSKYYTKFNSKSL